MAARPTAAAAIYETRDAAARTAAVATRPTTTAARNDATAKTGRSGIVKLIIKKFHLIRLLISGSCTSNDSTHAKTAADHSTTYPRDQHGAETAILSNDPASKAAISG